VASSVLAYSGVIALVLCIIGLYSVLAFSVAQRTREIGIRMALGAQPQNVLKLVIGQGMRLAGLGLAVGSIVAFAVMSVTSSLLYGVNARDPFTFVAVALIVVGIALGACFVPARRAIRVDPMVALRYE
jgi:putative ABC transport system permease protein